VGSQQPGTRTWASDQRCSQSWVLTSDSKNAKKEREKHGARRKFHCVGGFVSLHSYRLRLSTFMEGTHRDGARSYLATGCFLQRQPFASLLPSERDRAQGGKGAQGDQGEVRVQDLPRWERMPRLCDDDSRALRDMGRPHRDRTSSAEGSIQRLTDRPSPSRRVQP